MWEKDGGRLHISHCTKGPDDEFQLPSRMLKANREFLATREMPD